MAAPRILLATSNEAKQARLRWVLENVSGTIHSPQSLNLRLDVPETGKTHQENAMLKAVAWSEKVPGSFALATDGGLLVPSLWEQWDSVRTHRFAGDEATDVIRAERLLELMDDLTGMDRRASWTEAIALAHNGKPLACWQVSGADGFILAEFDPATIQPGFWIATLLYFPYLGKTYAQSSTYELSIVKDPWTKLRTVVGDALQTYLAGTRN